jgi:hypothetical protein
MKNSNAEHLQEMKDRNLLNSSKHNSKSQPLVYLTSPERSYVV